MEVLLGHHNECKSETNIDDGVATGVLAGNFIDDPVLKQHMFCMSKRLGIQNDDGEIQKEVVREKISQVLDDDEKVTEVTETCSVVRDTPEETAFELAKCIYEATH